MASDQKARGQAYMQEADKVKRTQGIVQDSDSQEEGRMYVCLFVMRMHPPIPLPNTVLRTSILYIMQALKRFSLFNASQKYEDAVEAYGKAGNCFKVG